MSMRSDLEKIMRTRAAKCHHEMMAAHQTDKVIKERINGHADKFRKQEEELSVTFMRTYSTDLKFMLDRETRIRRVIKEFMPQ